MRRRKARARHETLKELRIAALRRWEDEDTIASIAERLKRPAQDVGFALEGTVSKIIDAYQPGCSMAQLADDFAVPGSFARYCIRQFYAGIRSR